MSGILLILFFGEILAFLQGSRPTAGGVVLFAIYLGAIPALVLFQFRQRAPARHKARDLFSRRLIESQEAERKRIAAELHDSLGQTLMVIKNQAVMALQQAPGNNADHLREISASASHAIEEVRTIAYALRPYQLGRLGLTRAAASLIEKVADSSGIPFTSRLDSVDGLFGPQSETSLYRILQESLNNIVRHSSATQASVELARTGHAVSIRIADNGVGFTPDQDSRGLGLVGITERVRLLGGTSQIVSAPGRGTTIFICMECNGGEHER
ncbi:MAG TPA: sensor histidine kinase [Bryobacteraceae bacterium]|nr:sensor histidine kinase [Bryobacteraceae bacterium]